MLNLKKTIFTLRLPECNKPANDYKYQTFVRYLQDFIFYFTSYIILNKVVTLQIKSYFENKMVHYNTVLSSADLL